MSTNSLGTLTLDLLVETGGFQAGMDQAERIADKKTRQIERMALERAKAIEAAMTNLAKTMAAPLAGAAIGLGGIKSLDSLKASIESAIHGFADLKDAAERTGASVANLSSLKGVAKLGDHDFGEVEAAIGRMNKALHGTDDESKGAGKALAALGLDIQRLRQMDPAEALLELAKAQDKFADGGGKAAAMMAILGKSGAALIPYLKDLAEQGKLVGKVTTEQALAADEYEKNLKRLKGGWNTLSKEMAQAVVGPAKDVSDWMVRASKQGGVLQAVLVGIGAALTKAMGGEINPLKMAESDANSYFKQLAYAKQQLEILKKKQASENPIFGALTGFDMKQWESQIADIERKLKTAIRTRNRLLKGEAEASEPKDTSLNDQNFGTGEKQDKVKKETRPDLLTDAAKLYESAIKAIDQAQLKADSSALNLTATQSELLKVMSDPLFGQMPESWRMLIAAQAESALQAEKTADEQKRLNELLAATPTAQLEKSRENMLFLAQAFEQGRISAEQYIEAASAALKITSAEADEQKRLNDLMAATPTAQLEKQRDTMQFLAKAFEDGRINAEQYLEAAQTALGMLADKTKETDDFAKDLGLTFSSAFEEASIGGKKFSDVLKGLAQDVERILLRKMVTEPLANSIGSIDWRQFFTPNAKGGIYGSPSLSAYSGGIYDSPRLFAFANGAGVFGEAGPEAIMPLSRGSDGKLGVQASGLGGGNITINIKNEAGGDGYQATATARQNGAGIDIDVLIQRSMMNDMRRNGPLTQAMSQTFGLKRAV